MEFPFARAGGFERGANMEFHLSTFDGLRVVVYVVSC